MILVFVVLMMALNVGCSSTFWFIDAGAAEREARRLNKPMLFYFKTWDSTQHRNMRLQVFDDADVIAEMKDTINVELEYAWSGPYREKYNVNAPQVCVMTKPDGTKVSTAKYVNPVPKPEEFLEWLRRSKALAMPKSPEPATQPNS